MPYPKPFYRLVLFGKISGDTWNTSLSLVPNAIGEIFTNQVSAANLTEYAGIVGTWFPKVNTGGVGPGFLSQSTLEGIKLNRIGTDGKYMDPISRTHIYPTPIAGGAAETRKVPPQLAIVATLATAIPRGRGSHGRMYLPPVDQIVNVANDGLMIAGPTLNICKGVAVLIRQLNAATSLVTRVGVASDAGEGRFEHVTEVRVGRAVDTLRSRRNTLKEQYETDPI